MTTPKERKFLIMQVDKKNKNHRTYTKSIVQKWIESEKMTTGEGYDVEYAIEDADFDYEFLKEELICGNVYNLELVGDKLYGTVRFKTEGEFDGITKINEDADFLNSIHLVPKGKGAVKNQLVQDDYELYGFQVILKEESSFIEELESEEKGELATAK